ncbi:ornithine decarboxylase-like [Leptodactylus fuscus]|uniref:ornithine decarboxylase-like n=1 Tax=Leptodactylus fuscus TaxID=238119 RepID=UPI003F4F15D7
MLRLQDVELQDTLGKKLGEGSTTWKYDQLSKVTVVEEGISVMEFIKKKITSSYGQVKHDAFYVADLNDVVDKYRRFHWELPRVRPFYAVKCNNTKEVLQTLAFLGTGFDCASKVEIDMVLSLGVPANDIVYANTCKQPSHIRHAAKHGVLKMTFDCESELLKVSKEHPTAEMILRITADDSESMGCFSKKYGAQLQRCEYLLKLAKDLNLSVIGVSFHIGTKCRKPQAFHQGIADAKHVFDLGRKFGHVMRLLDIGGGFPGNHDFRPGLKEFAAVITEALDQYFPSKEGVEIISEPGRYFVGSAFTAALNIIGKKENHGTDGKEDRKISYYLNDGIFGTFLPFELQSEELQVKLLKDYHHSEKHFSSKLWGPCLTELDFIKEEVSLPELEIGDWIIFMNRGAYSLTIASALWISSANRMTNTQMNKHCHDGSKSLHLASVVGSFILHVHISVQQFQYGFEYKSFISHLVLYVCRESRCHLSQLFDTILRSELLDELAH